ncbi:hypothetical protein HMPREF9318_01749 [Streptococcus urinalis FB127-CNA-2]|uniref:Topology modulation protein n=1 Tax=Streptococcus urinalis 2285-97 TaxID=764291 RepID=G5KE99_9STRE|nr:DNA topology modulation protein [Streptococcus urinalis]EHJ57299.1 putative topology modulation protein [Streptococcus urinalis 2285-97]EKS18250.1 hypothetical protein HMPREF9318_01749 [Streptococcus urinalis FB127-CNA-2]VEF32876.1 topology modulation protein [Streptococcus urinalis]
MKIAIIGYSGSGKSTLARHLGQYYDCQPIHLDKLHFSSGWHERNNQEMSNDLSPILQKEQWNIEGNYNQCLYEERMMLADRIIFLNGQRFYCLWRVFKRYLAFHNKTRPDMADNCPERFDLNFIKWILWDGRTMKRKKNYLSVKHQYPQKLITLKNQKEIDLFLKTITQKDNHY